MEAYFYVYYAIHQYVADNDRRGKPIYSSKEIGVYTTRALAEDAIGRFRDLPGFRLYPDGFCILKCRCYCAEIPTRAQRTHKPLYAAYHEYYIQEEDCDYITRGAFYWSKESAEAEMNEWRAGRLFQMNPDGFDVSEYVLDEDERFWNEGFDKA